MTATGRGPLLAIDTATSQAVVALERPGAPPAVASWPAGQRHGEELLAAIERLLAGAGVEPGSARRDRRRDRTGGLHRACGSAWPRPRAWPTRSACRSSASRRRPPSSQPWPTGEPARPGSCSSRRDRATGSSSTRTASGSCRPGPSRSHSGRHGAARGRPRRPGAGRRPCPGRAAQERLGPTLLRLAAARLAAGDADDLARLVPEYVSLPRGVRSLAGSIEWSRDLR